jgi:hypothetical protein
MSAASRGLEGGGISVGCNACGGYSMTAAGQYAAGAGSLLAFKVGCWIREQRLGVSSTIDPDTVAFVKGCSTPTVRRRPELFLIRAIEITTDKLTAFFSGLSNELRVASWSNPLSLAGS